MLKIQPLGLLLVLASLGILLMIPVAMAQLTLEKSQEWTTMSATAVYSVFAGDVDGDAATKIITGGYAWDGWRDNGQLRVWSFYVAPPIGIPEFSLSLPITTSTGAALYLLLKKRLRKN